MKYFILFTIILIALKFMDYIIYKYTNHGWSRLGYKEKHPMYAMYFLYSYMFFIMIGIIACIKFFIWFKTI